MRSRNIKYGYLGTSTTHESSIAKQGVNPDSFFCDNEGGGDFYAGTHNNAPCAFCVERGSSNPYGYGFGSYLLLRFPFPGDSYPNDHDTEGPDHRGGEYRNSGCIPPEVIEKWDRQRKRYVPLIQKGKFKQKESSVKKKKSGPKKRTRRSPLNRTELGKLAYDAATPAVLGLGAWEERPPGVREEWCRIAEVLASVAHNSLDREALGQLAYKTYKPSWGDRGKRPWVSKPPEVRDRWCRAGEAVVRAVRGS